MKRRKRPTYVWLGCVAGLALSTEGIGREETFLDAMLLREADEIYQKALSFDHLFHITSRVALMVMSN